MDTIVQYFRAMIFSYSIDNSITNLFASIFVTGVSQTDIITLATPDGKVKYGRWITQDGINGFLFEKLIEYGIYIVTANNGENAVVKEVSINTSTKFEVYISYGYIQDGLLLHWDGLLNNGNSHSSTPTTWKDLSGNGRDGIFTNSPTIGEDYIETNGSSQYITTEESTLMSTQKKTYEIVFSRGSNHSSHWVSPIYYGLTGDKPRFKFQFTYYSSADKGYSQFGIEVRNGNNVADGLDSDIHVERSTNLLDVKHYAVTFDRSGYIIVYVNGKEYTRGTSVLSSEVATDGTLFRIGADGNPRYVNTRCYCVRIYDRVLSAEEIAKNYQFDLARFPISE